VLQASLGDYIGTATYSKAVDEVGLLQFALPADHAAIAYLTDKAQVEVWRRDTGRGVAWHADYYGLVRTTQYQYPSDSPETFTVWCPSQLSMLGWRIVAWAANTASRSAFTTAKAETIMKTLVSYNAASSATVANGRIREGAISGLTVAADGAAGNTLDWNCAYANLLKTLQDVAKVAGGDFDLIASGAGTWEFRFYTGQRGTDRTTTVLFALERGNMANPVLTDSRADEATVCIVGGQGEGAARTTATRTGTNYNATTNNIETFKDGRSLTTAAGLNAAGDEALDKVEAKRAFTFDVVETPALVYNRDFYLGDLVKAQYRGVTDTVKIQGVTVSFDKDGKESKSFSLQQP
jgi:hypothetical protein